MDQEKRARKLLFLTAQEAVFFVKKEIQVQFGKDMELLRESVDAGHHGWFLLTFLHLPSQYQILFEGEFNSFNIQIRETENKGFGLNRRMDYSQHLTVSDIRLALEKLYKVLDEL